MDVTDPQHQRLVRRDREMVPTVLVRAMLALCCCALLIVAYARLTDRPLEAMPALGDAQPIVSERYISISADPTTGAARVFDARGAVIADLGPEQGGFIAGVQRALAFERNRQGVPEIGARAAGAVPDGAAVLARRHDGLARRADRLRRQERGGLRGAARLNRPRRQTPGPMTSTRRERPCPC